MKNYNNPQDLEHPEDQQKGKIVAGVYFVLVLIVLFMPWFSQMNPLPEPGGLMAAFGNVEIAGGSEDFVQEEPSPEQPEEQPEEPVEEPVEEVTEPIEEVVETVDNTDAPVVEKVEDPKPEPRVEPTPPKPKPKPKINNNALFPGNSNSNGKGTGQGDGIQGTPDGKKELGGTGNGDQGKGNGQGLGQRRILSKCSDYDSNSATWSEKTTIIVNVCVNARGQVATAQVNRRKSKTNDSRLLDLALECAKQYRYEPAPGQPDACGEVTVHLKLN